jgi:hypothetical protein
MARHAGRRAEMKSEGTKTVDLILHEENWLSLIWPLDTFAAVTNAIGG